MRSPHKTALLILAAFFYLFFRGIGDHGLLDPVEGINASVSLNMVARRDLTAPLAGDLPWMGSKTTGSWWLSALALTVFGWTEFSVRFWSAAAALGTVASVWFIARRLRNERSAHYAAVIAGTGLITYVTSQFASGHALFVCFTTLALAGVIHAFWDRRFFLLLHVSSVLAFIAWGPAGFLLPWLALLIYVWLIEQEHFFLNAFFYLPGLAATLLLGGGYLLLLYVNNPALLRLMCYNPPAPILNTFFAGLVLLLVGLCPWFGVYAETLLKVIPRWQDLSLPGRREDVLLPVWSGVFLIYGLFAGDGLLVAAAFPALASLCGNRLAQGVEENDIAIFRRVMLYSVFFLLLLLPFGIFQLCRSGGILEGTLSSLIPWAFFCLLSIPVGRYYIRTRQPKKLMLHLSLLALLSLLPAAGVFDLRAEQTSLRNVGRYLRENMDKEDLLTQYAMNRPSLYFYTARDSMLLHTEPLPGIMDQKVANDSRLQQAWRSPVRVFMLIERSQQIETSLPQEVFNLHEASRFIVLSNLREKVMLVPTTPQAPGNLR